MDAAAALDAVLAAAAVAVALMTKPWRSLAGTSPPWAWVLAWATLPLLWSLDHQLGGVPLPPLSGAVLLVLMTGWPLAVLACVPMAALTIACGQLDTLQALHRTVWLGIVPATVALGLGAALRRWLPCHVGIYVLGRGFFGAGACVGLASALGGTLTAWPATADAWLVPWLMALGEAFTTGAIVTLLVAQRPDMLATYSDRLYLEARATPR
jgi:uncharacterized membrane protein